MSTISFDLEKLYQQVFGGKPYQIPPEIKKDPTEEPNVIRRTPSKSYVLLEKYLNREIWLPTRLAELNIDNYDRSEFYLPYCVVKISGKKTIVKTPLAERQGTVKELYSIDDYSINLKGFFIDNKNRLFPEKDLDVLRQVFEMKHAFSIDNALINIMLGKEVKVVMESFDLPEVEGGRKHVRPYNIQLESDSVFTLEV
ncbi:MAG: DUF6046 domain-containing protein [Niastella sp.]|jgi:hypothetical protein|uniref:DUF6046 domain-containing protein n=1 Tax=Niastella sp. TaxID=1869183 RepID=UPI00389A7B7B